MWGWQTEDELAYLKNLAFIVDDNRNGLEIGCLFGKSTMALLDGFKEQGGDYKLTVVDPFCLTDPTKPYPPVIFFEELYKHGYHDKVKFIKATTREALPIIIADEYAFAFIDGDHRAFPTLFDLIICSTRTELMAIHDYHSDTHREVNKGVDTFIEYSGWKHIDSKGTIALLSGKKILSPIFEQFTIP